MSRPSNRPRKKSGKHCPKCGRQMETQIAFLECPGCGHIIHLGTASAARRDRKPTVISEVERIRQSLFSSNESDPDDVSLSQFTAYELPVELNTERKVLALLPLIYFGLFYILLRFAPDFQATTAVMNTCAGDPVNLFAIYLIMLISIEISLFSTLLWLRNIVQVCLTLVAMLHLLLLAWPDAFDCCVVKVLSLHSILTVTFILVFAYHCWLIIFLHRDNRLIRGS